jgi:hypothetical protein
MKWVTDGVVVGFGRAWEWTEEGRMMRDADLTSISNGTLNFANPENWVLFVERNLSAINLVSKSLDGQLVDNSVDSEERRRASSSLPEICAADLSDGEMSEACIRHWTKGVFVEMFFHGQSCLRL